MKIKNINIYTRHCEECFSTAKQSHNNVGDCFAATNKSVARNDINIAGGAQ